MICPQCGAAMNHHADKVEYASFDGPGELDFDGVVLQIYQCPRCPMVATQTETTIE